MSYNGSGTFIINTAGQPVVTGSTITSTAFNALTADLANGLSTALCKDGQSTPTANISLGGFKITNLAVGTLGTDSARLSQVQSGSATYITVSGADTIVAAGTPALTAYAAGNAFNFVAAGANTGAVTLNIDGLGAKAVTKDGTTALVANDILSGQVVSVVYDGTRFQVVNQNAFTAPLTAAKGGTGQSSYVIGDILYASGTTALSKLADVATGNVLISGGVGVAPSYGKVGLTTHVSGTLPVANGGTGVTSSTGSGSVVLSASPALTGTPTSGGIEVGYRSVPRSATSGTTAATSERGYCYAATGTMTIPASTFAAGDALSIYNNSASAITISQGSGLTLRQAGTSNTGSRTLAAYGLVTVWFNSATEAIVSGAGLS